MYINMYTETQRCFHELIIAQSILVGGYLRLIQETEPQCKLTRRSASQINSDTPREAGSNELITSQHASSSVI